MTHHPPRLLSRLRGSRGATLVEAAFVTPLLLLLTFAIVDFAAIFYAYLALENGVSQASRFAVTGSLVGTLSREDSIRSAMRTATPTLTIDDAAFTFSHRPPGSATWLGGTGGPSDIEKVTVNYRWEIWTPIMRPFFDDGALTMRVESAMKNEGRFE